MRLRIDDRVGRGAHGNFCGNGRVWCVFHGRGAAGFVDLVDIGAAAAAMCVTSMADGGGLICQIHLFFSYRSDFR